MSATAKGTVELSLTRQPNQISRDALHGGMKLIREALTNAGFEGLFAVTPHERITMKGDKRIRVTIFKEGNVLINCRPGDNGTAWEWWVRPPHPLTPEHCHRILTALETPEPVNGHATKPRFAESPAIDDPKNLLSGDAIATDHPDEDGMSRLVSRLTTAGTRAKAYRAREDLINRAKAELEKAETVLLEAQDQHDRLREVYESCRNQHLNDVKGKEAAAFMETLKGLE